jgi:hypothetical protein
MIRALPALALALATLTACGGSDTAKLDELDARLGNKADADPALTMALEDQIMVDPQLTQQANDDAIRPAERPVQSPIPPGEGGPARAKPGETLGALAAKQAQIAKDRFNGCLLDVDYSAGWAARLPRELPMFPKSRVVEAAGSNNGSCGLRAVSYSAPAAPAMVAKFYDILGQRAGYRTATGNENGGLMVSGSRASDGSAFYAIVQPAAGGSATDFVSNRGR